MGAQGNSQLQSVHRTDVRSALASATERLNTSTLTATNSTKPGPEPTQPLSQHHVRLVQGCLIGALLACPLAMCLISCCRQREFETDGETNVVDALSYKPQGLLSWDVICRLAGTVWVNPSLWIISRRLLAISMVMALLFLVFDPDPSSIDPMRFAAIGAILTVFVGLLLTFFLSSSVTRWLNCVNGFLALFNAIRNLHMQLHALGVAQEQINLIMRFCVVSARLLFWDLCRGHAGLHAPDHHESINKKMWADLEDNKGAYSHLLQEEEDLLKSVGDPCSHAWMLVTSLLGRLAMDGEIPPMASATYGRLFALAQDAQDALRQVRISMELQMPYLYVHAVAILVHLNNILCAISFGLTLGACTGSVMVQINPQFRFHRGWPHPEHRMDMDWQYVMIQFFQCIVAPILYQSFLEIGISIASPFSCDVAAIPVERFCAKLEEDLLDGNRIANNPPGWKKPSYKEETATRQENEAVDSREVEGD